MTVRRAFEPTDESVYAARQFVIAMIVDAKPEVRDSVSLMVSELSTNALVHGDSGFYITVDRADHAVVISVSDRGGGTPVLHSPGPTEPHGRGLRIVDALSDAWGIATTCSDGKTVWFRMSLSPSVPDSASVEATTAATTDPEARENPLPTRGATPRTIPARTKTRRPISRRRGPGRKLRGGARSAGRILRHRSTG